MKIGLVKNYYEMEKYRARKCTHITKERVQTEDRLLLCRWMVPTSRSQLRIRGLLTL